MSTDDPARLRLELTEAIARVRGQIDVEMRSGHYVGDGAITSGALAELQAELVALEGALAEVKQRGG